MFDQEAGIQYVAQQMGYRTPQRYQTRCEFIYQDVPLAGKRVIDVGCGNGGFALWAAMNGAGYTLGIEPESDGSTDGTLAKFNTMINHLNFNDMVEAKSLYLNDLSPSPDELFDVVLMYNVINHIDEDAVSNVHENEASQQRYINHLKHLRSLVSNDAYVIIADAGRKNFWNDVGLTNPVFHYMNWEKHQQPDVWTSLFEQAGFKFENLRWSPIYPFYGLTNNRIVQYFWSSHFILRFRAVD